MDPNLVRNALVGIINQARTNPSPTAEQMYKILTPLYRDQQLHCWNKVIQTFEGKQALQDLHNQLNKYSASNILQISQPLNRAAQIIAEEKGSTGRTDHQTPQAIFQKISLMADVKGRVGELIALKAYSGQQIATYFLLDDGLATRKRRRMLLDGGYRFIGVGTAAHRQHETITVILLAQHIGDLHISQRTRVTGENNSYFHALAVNRPVQTDYHDI